MSIPGSASVLPYYGSAAASASAPLSGKAQIPSAFAKALDFSPLLEREDISIKKEIRKKETSTIVNRPLATKEVQIVVPKKPNDRCSRLVSEQQYNSEKTYTGNLIDWVVCNTQNLVKRIGKFF